MQEHIKAAEIAAAWHDRPVDDAFVTFSSGPQGLKAGEAKARLTRYGPNVLPSAPTRSPLARFLSQFNNVLIYVLIAAAVITALLEHWIDVGVILAVVVGNAIIGYVQEGRAEKALNAIKDMLAPTAVVIRDGARVTVPAREVVPGDIAILDAGERVPADLRLAVTKSLQIEEAALTGESVPVDKDGRPVASDAALGDRTSMAYSGTLVSRGFGRGVVVATGSQTEIGRISGMLGSVETLDSPLVRAIDAFGRKLTIVILGVSVAIFLFGWLVRDYALPDIFMAVVGLAVAAIPEGLPAVITITLALGVESMARRNAIARRLPAIETLGSVSTICSDKTGTITRNEMMVTQVAVARQKDFVTGTGYAPEGGIFDAKTGEPTSHTTEALLQELATTAVLASDAEISERDGTWRPNGDPMEGALLAFAQKAGVAFRRCREKHPRRNTIPFDSQIRLMATLNADRDGQVIHVKGAPDVLIDMADAELGVDGAQPIDRDYWLAEVDRIAAEGLRVLAFARKRTETNSEDLGVEMLSEAVVLLGLAGLEDPPRQEAIEAIGECQDAGIAVKMVTGDHAATAKAIARRAGLDNPDRALTGAELDGLDQAAYRIAVRDTNVFARVSPENKLRLVEALQEDGSVVAMTGDGVNDAPALKRADIGVAMGQRGSAAAKEAAELVLADDNFATIAAAVHEGRRTYDNIIKTIGFMLPTNAAESMVLIAAILFALPLPITPVQILWINLVTAVTLALALTFDPASDGIMQRPPRPVNAPILSAQLVRRTLLASALFLAGVFAVFSIALAYRVEIETARTIAANTLVVFEIAFLFNVHLDGRRGRLRTKDLATRPILIASGLVILFQLLFTYAPIFNTLFGTRPVPVAGLIAIGLAGIIAFLAVEVLFRLEARYGGSDATEAEASDTLRARPRT